MTTRFDLNRFLKVQQPVYPQVLAELREGRKRSHWIWFIFPQLAGLGHSPTARYYGLNGLAEARAYLGHPMLRERLVECRAALKGWAGRKAIADILGELDAMKIQSSMTLFELASSHSDNGYAQMLDAFYDGERDMRTRSMVDAEADA